MTRELLGKRVGKWLIEEYIGCGKSALVFRGSADGQSAAVKVFDPEVVETHGDKKQLERIEREKSLIGLSHPNLVQIFDGGVSQNDEGELFYVVMELVPAENLASQLTAIKHDQIWGIISKVASAAVFLDSNGLCHRDIKPENIAVDVSTGLVKLLDLGVLRPVISELTDTSALPFLGTLRYAPPELLLREEQATPDGWRAITFYQLGGVIHDLIMRAPLFQDFTHPYARLVNAVQSERPKISSSEVAADLITLAKNCLSKNPETRSATVTWADFQPPAPSADPIALIKERITKRRISAQTEHKITGKVGRTAEEIGWSLKEYAWQVRSGIREECVGNSVFPRLILSELELCGGDCQRFSATFEPSEEHELHVFLTFIVQVGWFDSADDAISISIQAVAKGDRNGTNGGEPGEGNHIYQGNFNREKVTAAISPFLYAAFDAAQQLPNSNETVSPRDPIIFGVELLERAELPDSSST
jgi:serine/threonine protein kinase